MKLKQKWKWKYRHRSGVVFAPTKGDARNLVKRVLGISVNHGRVPKDCVIERAKE